ncbi:unnamed protein product, partial [Effrenium voratum]
FFGSSGAKKGRLESSLQAFRSMASQRRPVLALVAAALLVGHLTSAFLSPQAVPRAELSQAQSAVVAAGLAAATALPQQALAVRAASEDDEGFDLRIVAVLALPLFAVSWALFNVWRVAFRQVGRIGESAKGNAL